MNKCNKNILFELCTNILIGKEFEDVEIVTLNEINEIMKKKIKKQLLISNQKKNVKDAEVLELKRMENNYVKLINLINLKYSFLEICYTNELKRNFKTWLSINTSNKIYLKREIEAFVCSSSEDILETTLESIINNINIDFQISKLEDKYYIIKLLFTDYINKIKQSITSSIDLVNRINLDIRRYNNQIILFSDDKFINEALKDPCSICFTNYESEFVLTKCQHIFCIDCKNTLFNNKTYIHCPFCRTSLEKKQDVKTVSIQIVNEVKEENNDDEQQIINKYGTKLNYLIKYLTTVFKDNENRVIIFSQYDKMLKLISKVLNDFDIKHLFMKGNVNVLNKNITKFKTDSSYKVIMLSSETSASGNNLTEANHIIFIDVLNADKEKTQSIEQQAIGRSVRLGQKKNVIVKRIIMSNTIEQEYYDKNKYNVSTI